MRAFLIVIAGAGLGSFVSGQGFQGWRLIDEDPLLTTIGTHTQTFENRTSAPITATFTNVRLIDNRCWGWTGEDFAYPGPNWDSWLSILVDPASETLGTLSQAGEVPANKKLHFHRRYETTIRKQTFLPKSPPYQIAERTRRTEEHIEIERVYEDL
ncbi:MAG: hypothetical protein MH204_08230 [Fimbriimonadaceae bacterium]|nr:hypothetical protein [Fimbriimonadaceae bacterium]